MLTPAEFGRSRPIGSAMIVLLAIAVFILPIPTDFNVVRTLVKLSRANPAAEIVIGNSVVDHVSRCDVDQRSIPQLLAERSGVPTIDASYGGQPFAVALNVAALSLRRSGVTGVTMLISPFAFTSSPELDARTQLFFRATAGSLLVNDWQNGPLARRQLAATTTASLTAFSYGGVRYPDYAGVQARFMTRERDAMPCPENLGHDQRFIEAYYWNAYLRTPIDMRYITDLAALNARARASGQRLRLVLLPIDYHDVTQLNPVLAAAIKARYALLYRALRAAGLAPIDLSREGDARFFADRWCACGHLSLAGRLAVATAVAG